MLLLMGQFKKASAYLIVDRALLPIPMNFGSLVGQLGSDLLI
jgi:hypothetical protein